MTLKSNLSRTVTVGSRRIGYGEPIFLTAEIGSAHLGSVENAKKLIKAAADAGCDGADIFMSFADEFYYCSVMPNTDDIKKVVRELEFSRDQWKELFDYADSCGIILYPTPLDYPSIELCRELKVKMININSDDANNPLLLKRAATLGVPITMHDINMSISEMTLAVRTLHDCGVQDIILLHSTMESGEIETLYATANLEVINTYKQLFGGSGVLAGCVEHTTSDFLIYAVAAMKPALISKHIQLSHDNPHDTEISVDVTSLNSMVQKVRFVEMSLGNGFVQELVDKDGNFNPNHGARRKVLVAVRDIPAGKVIEEADLAAKRPGHLGGMAPGEYIHFVGATAKQTILRDTVMNFDLVEHVQSAPYKYPGLDRFRIGRDLKDFRGA